MSNKEPLLLRPVPLSDEAFAPFGDVIAVPDSAASAMNDGRFARYDHLSKIAGQDPCIGIVESLEVADLPWRIELVERHHDSQAFIPLQQFVFIVVVAQQPEAADLQAFVSNGKQGINYHPGTWHMPLTALATGQQFLVIDQGQAQHTETAKLRPPVLLTV